MKKYLWGAVFSALLTAAAVYTLLDAFVIEREYEVPPPLTILGSPSPTSELTPIQTPSPTPELTPPPSPTADEAGGETAAKTPEPTPEPSPEPTPEPTPSPSPAVIITDWSYDDGDIQIEIEKISGFDTTYYIAELWLSDVSYLKTAFAKGKYGKNITEKVSKIAEDNNAIFAVNGDYYGFRDDGVIIRNGVFYRNTPRVGHHSNMALLIDGQGDFSTFREGDLTDEDLAALGILHGFSFGPPLVVNGLSYVDGVEPIPQPRAAIGQAGPLHYVVIVAEGRNDNIKGMTMNDLADIFIERGCETAYNLDGGGSVCMWFHGRTIYTQSDRAISDIIYITGRDGG